MVTLLRWDILLDPHTGLPMVSIVCERSFYTQEKKGFHVIPLYHSTISLVTSILRRPTCICNPRTLA